jgi:hypothetical protein
MRKSSLLYLGNQLSKHFKCFIFIETLGFFLMNQNFILSYVFDINNILSKKAAPAFVYALSLIKVNWRED